MELLTIAAFLFIFINLMRWGYYETTNDLLHSKQCPNTNDLLYN